MFFSSIFFQINCITIVSITHSSTFPFFYKKSCALVNDLVQKSKAAVEALLDPSENTVEYIRLHTGKNKEIIIAPAREYTLIAVQEPISTDVAVVAKE